MRGTGGGMECLAGDAVRGLLWPADASLIGRRAFGVGQLGLVLGGCKVSRVMMVGCLLLSAQRSGVLRPGRQKVHLSITAGQGYGLLRMNPNPAEACDIQPLVLIRSDSEARTCRCET